MDLSALERAAKDLEGSLDSLGFWLFFSTALVVIGLIAEYRHDVIEFWEEVRRPAAMFPWPKFWAIAGGILVTVGVAGELIVGIKASRKESDLRTINHQIEGLLTDKASENDKEAKRLGKEAEQLRKDAEAEHLARVTIEARVAWRRLDDKRKSELASKLGDFSNSVGASFWFLGSDIEAETFADDMAEALKLSHVVVQPPANIMSLKSSGKFGDPIKRSEVGVSIFPSKYAGSIKLADGLIRELNLLGFDTARRKDLPFKDSKFPEVEIFVYPRPDGPQGEYKLQAEREAKAKKKQAQSNQITH